MSDLANKLQAKIKTYKKQIEEAEEIAALNLAKFRKAQQELEETEERAKLAEASLSEIFELGHAIGGLLFGDDEDSSQSSGLINPSHGRD